MAKIVLCPLRGEPCPAYNTDTDVDVDCAWALPDAKTKAKKCMLIGNLDNISWSLKKLTDIVSNISKGYDGP